MNDHPPTDRQRAIYNYIVDHIDKHGYAPSYREIMREFEIASPNGVTCHIKALVDKGYIETDGVARSITVVEREKRLCPHCGKEIDGD